MLFESILYATKVYKNKDTKENFSEKPVEWTLLDIIYIVSLMFWSIIAFALWVRIIVSAFYSSTGEGFASLIFPTHYSLYKFGDFINFCQDKTQTLY